MRCRAIGSLLLLFAAPSKSTTSELLDPTIICSPKVVCGLYAPPTTSYNCLLMIQSIFGCYDQFFDNSTHILFFLTKDQEKDAVKDVVFFFLIKDQEKVLVKVVVL